MNKVSFDSHWMFCCWLYMYGAFFGWILTTLLAFACRETNSNTGWEKINKATRKIQIQQISPSPAPKPPQRSGHSSGKLWPREEPRCGWCPLSPSLTHTVDTDGSDLPFWGSWHTLTLQGLLIFTRSDNPQKGMRKWIPPAGPALRSCCSQGGQRLVRAASFIPLRLQVHHLYHLQKP